MKPERLMRRQTVLMGHRRGEPTGGCSKHAIAGKGCVKTSSGQSKSDRGTSFNRSVQKNTPSDIPRCHIPVSRGVNQPEFDEIRNMALFALVGQSTEAFATFLPRLEMYISPDGYIGQIGPNDEAVKEESLLPIETSSGEVLFVFGKKSQDRNIIACRSLLPRVAKPDGVQTRWL